MIYLTGQNGFLGTNIATMLSNEYKIEPIKYSEIKSTLCSKKQKHSNSTLIHTAWLGVAGSERNSRCQALNIDLTHLLCDFVLKNQITRVIALGSQAEYGVQNIVLTEDSKLKPITEYGIYKAKCHEILRDRLEHLDVEVIWLRLFDCYGPYDKPHWLIPYVISCALSNKDAVLTPCNQYWDFLYVLDVVRAVRLLIQNNSSYCQQQSSTYNLSSGVPVALSEVVNYIYQTINPVSGKPLFGKRTKRHGELDFLCGSNSCLRNDIGWSPSYDIYSGIVETIEWHKSNAHKHI